MHHDDDNDDGDDEYDDDDYDDYDEYDDNDDNKPKVWMMMYVCMNGNDVCIYDDVCMYWW